MLHWNTISEELKQVLHEVMSESAFEEFCLCGGTALALQLGHRLSVDADFVCPHFFDKQKLANNANVIFPNAAYICRGVRRVYEIAEYKDRFFIVECPFYTTG